MAFVRDNHPSRDVVEYIDEGLSDSLSVFKRPSLNKLLSDMNEGDVLLEYDPSRIKDHEIVLSKLLPSTISGILIMIIFTQNSELFMKMSYLVALFPLFVACGDDTKKEDPKPTVQNEEPKKAEPKKEEPKKEEPKKEEPKPTESASPVTVNADGVAEVVIGATDTMQYTVKEFTVKAGQKVKLTLKHTGKLPKAAMGHNLVILKPGVEANAFATAAVTAKDYFPEDKVDQTIAHTALIGGGETSTIEFTAPEAGTYEYICSYPNHWAMMLGKMIVQ